MEFYDEKIKALAIEIYELDAEVYKKLGSSSAGYLVARRIYVSVTSWRICTQGRTAQESKRACPDKQHGKNNT